MKYMKIGLFISIIVGLFTLNIRVVAADVKTNLEITFSSTESVHQKMVDQLNKFPKTGDQHLFILMILGVILVIALLYIYKKYLNNEKGE